MIKTDLKMRREYLDKLVAFRDTDMIKVITGIRRCGKSSLMKLMVAYLCSNGIEDDQIIEINFESLRFSEMSVNDLYSYVSKRIDGTKRMYLFFDEIQLITDWQKAINSFRVDFDCDIYITGSNAFLLSSELSTYLSGRFVEIKMLPLSFQEFIDFQNCTLSKTALPNGAERTKITAADGENVDVRDMFDAYVKFGGMPSIMNTSSFDQERISTILDGIYATVVVRDILERSRINEKRTVTDPILLRKLVMFLADNIGSNISANSISNTLSNEKMLPSKPAVQTVQAYIEALTEAYVFYEIKRYDIRGREFLRTLGKYYVVDLGLRNYLLGFRDGDSGHILENIVYFELLRRGYGVAIGKIDNKEIDFIATKTDQKIYIQVTESIHSAETRERELAPLRLIQDNYEKIIITLEKPLISDFDGIKVVNALDFLLE